MRKIIFAVSLLCLITGNAYSQMVDWSETEKKEFAEKKASKVKALVEAARSLIDPNVVYDPSYVKIDYPMGDVPADRGVCTDLVIRAFRKAFDWDLQESIYEYRKWNGDKTDTNIDHRRVKNLVPFFDHIADMSKSYANCDGDGRDLNKCEAGDILVWDLGYGQWHIGICVSDSTVVHQICCGQEESYIESVYGKIIRNYRLWEMPIKKIL